MGLGTIAAIAYHLREEEEERKKKRRGLRRAEEKEKTKWRHMGLKSINGR